MVKKITIPKDVIVTILIAGISMLLLGGGISVIYAQSTTSPDGYPEGHPLASTTRISRRIPKSSA